MERGEIEGGEMRERERKGQRGNFKKENTNSVNMNRSGRIRI